MYLNARTKVTYLHESLEPFLKRLKKGVYGPDNNCTALVFFDDLNIVKKEN